MSADRLRRYRFATEAQWNACLQVQADCNVLRAGSGVQPFAPFARIANLYLSPGAHAPVVTSAGEILWTDDRGALHRLPVCGDDPETFPAPHAIGSATRIVGSSSGLWVIGTPPESLERYESESLTRLMTVDVSDARVIDIAAGERGSIEALVECGGGLQVRRFDQAGQLVRTVTFLGLGDASAFVFLRRTRRFVVLANGHPQKLFWLAAQGGRPLFSVPIPSMRPCFHADVLGSDTRDRVLLAGADGVEFGGGAYALVLDVDGNLLDQVAIDPPDPPATGVVATRDSLLVTGSRGLLRFATAEVVPEGAGPISCVLLTPVLFSPDREDQRRWLRVDATATLPEGSSIEIAFASTDDIATRDRLNAIAADPSKAASQRVRELRSEPDLWRGRAEFHGSSAHTSDPKAVFAAKLFEVRDRYLWVAVTLSAAAGGRLPLLSELAVLYPGRTLMENLPSIYQREESRPDSFLRSLVGVLEATTQGIDARIAAMGSLVHPATAPEPWLDLVARWLGLPWDDALSEAQKRAIVTQTAALAKGRGTRAGLEVLLDALIPGTPRRFRVIDATADFGFAIVGDAACAGTALPAMLGGRTAWSAELNSGAVLGRLRLPCDGQRDDGTYDLGGRVRVEVAATSAERKLWTPWLHRLISEMVPLTARLTLSWVSAQALRSDRLDGSLTLEAAPSPHLGTDAITSVARLPDRGARLSASGQDLGTRLR
jgi:phage tail-like protein